MYHIGTLYGAAEIVIYFRGKNDCNQALSNILTEPIQSNTWRIKNSFSVIRYHIVALKYIGLISTKVNEPKSSM